jgi:hypothetical protein
MSKPVVAGSMAVLVLAIAAAAVLVGRGTGHTTALPTAPASSHGTTTTMTAPPAADTVTVTEGTGERLSVTFEGLTDPDTAAASTGCPKGTWTPTTQRTIPTTRLVSVSFTVVNHGSRILRSSDAWAGVALIDDSHAMLSGSCVSSTAGTVNLLPGTSVSGSVVVSVPVGDTISTVEYRQPFGLTGTAYWRVHDVAPPPLPSAVPKPRVRDCTYATYTGAVTLRPTELYVSCATKYTVVLSRLTWATWGTTAARGSGTVGTWRCVRGPTATQLWNKTRHCYAATVVLSNPVTTNGALVFSHLSVTSTGPTETLGTGWGA